MFARGIRGFERFEHTLTAQNEHGVAEGAGGAPSAGGGLGSTYSRLLDDEPVLTKGATSFASARDAEALLRADLIALAAEPAARPRHPPGGRPTMLEGDRDPGVAAKRRS